MKKLNKTQKRIIFTSAILIMHFFIFWILYGGEIFTKTEILVEVKDELFDTTYKEWQNKFIWGLDLSLGLSALTALVSSFLLFFARTKNETV